MPFKYLYDEEFSFLDTSRLWVFWWYLCFWHHSSLYTLQEPSYLSKIFLVSMWFTMVLTKIITWGVQRFSDFGIHAKYQYLNDITIFDIHGEVCWYHYDVVYWYTAFHMPHTQPHQLNRTPPTLVLHRDPRPMWLPY